MSSTQFWTGMLVPQLIKWVNPYLKRYFKLAEIDNKAKTRVFSKTYPAYFGFLYSLWFMVLFSTGFIVLIWFMTSGPTLFAGKSYAVPVFLGFINMIGVWFIAGATLNFVFWQISSENFRDYIKFRQIKSGWAFYINQQIITLFKIGIIYYIVTSPLIAYLLIR